MITVFDKIANRINNKIFYYCKLIESEEPLKGACCKNCPIKKECMVVTKCNLIFNIENTIDNLMETIQDCITRKTKKYYKCFICGKIEAPYFYDDINRKKSITHSYGWGKIKTPQGEKYWICHNCLYHERQKVPNNKNIINLIKNKDYSYYLKHQYELEEKKDD